MAMFGSGQPGHPVHGESTPGEICGEIPHLNPAAGCFSGNTNCPEQEMLFKLLL